MDDSKHGGAVGRVEHFYRDEAGVHVFGSEIFEVRVRRDLQIVKAVARNADGTEAVTVLNEMRDSHALGDLSGARWKPGQPAEVSWYPPELFHEESVTVRAAAYIPAVAAIEVEFAIRRDVLRVTILAPRLQRSDDPVMLDWPVRVFVPASNASEWTLEIAGARRQDGARRWGWRWKRQLSNLQWGLREPLVFVKPPGCVRMVGPDRDVTVAVAGGFRQAVMVWRAPFLFVAPRTDSLAVPPATDACTPDGRHRATWMLSARIPSPRPRRRLCGSRSRTHSRRRGPTSHR